MILQILKKSCDWIQKQSALDKKICRKDKLQVIFNGVDIESYENGAHGAVTRKDLNIPEDAFYRKVRLYKDNTIKHVYNTIIYASLLYVVPFQAMEDSFYINKVTIGYVMELAILYVCVLFVFKKIRLK